MYDRLLIPTDGSEPASRAARAAIDIAGQFDATVHAIYVNELEPMPVDFKEVPEEFSRRLETVVADIEQMGAEADVTVITDIVRGDRPVHRSIIDYATDNEVDAIVMGTRGRSGIERYVLGSVTERTIRESPVPVISVTEEAQLQADLETILVPTDGSDGARVAIEHAGDLAAAAGAAVHVVYVVDTGILGADASGPVVIDALEQAGERAIEEATNILDRPEIPSVQASILSGTPARAIRDYAAEHEISAIVMGTHGRSGVERLFLGSVTEGVVRKAAAPVVTVRPPELEE